MLTKNQLTKLGWASATDPGALTDDPEVNFEIDRRRGGVAGYQTWESLPEIDKELYRAEADRWPNI